MEPAPDDRGPQGWELRLQGGAHGRGEPFRGLHDHVDDEGAAAEPQLSVLPVEVRDRWVPLTHCAGANAAPPVEDAVDRRLAQAGLQGDLTDPVPVTHRDFLKRLLMAGPVASTPVLERPHW